MQQYKNCQSCGMPFNNKPERHGTNADGLMSEKFCNYCFQNGKFTQPDFTATQMQQFVKNKLKEMGWFHGLFAGPFTKGIPKLERWKQSAQAN